MCVDVWMPSFPWGGSLGWVTNDLFHLGLTYKVVCFHSDGFGIAGKHLEFGGDERRPADQLLRWHFRQTGVGEYEGSW